MTFKDLQIGQEFDFIDDDKPMFNSFYLRCTKISSRKYRDERSQEHCIGSTTATVFHAGYRASKA